MTKKKVLIYILMVALVFCYIPAAPVFANDDLGGDPNEIVDNNSGDPGNNGDSGDSEAPEGNNDGPADFNIANNFNAPAGPAIEAGALKYPVDKKGKESTNAGWGELNAGKEKLSANQGELTVASGEGWRVYIKSDNHGPWKVFAEGDVPAGLEFELYIQYKPADSNSTTIQVRTFTVNYAGDIDVVSGVKGVNNNSINEVRLGTVTLPSGSSIIPDPLEVGSLIVKKIVLDENGELGEDGSFKFKLSNKDGYEVDFVIDTKDGEGSKIFTDLECGDYTVEEIDIPEGYELDSITNEGKVTIINGETAEVTVTNTAKGDEPPKEDDPKKEDDPPVQRQDDGSGPDPIFSSDSTPFIQVVVEAPVAIIEEEIPLAELEIIEEVSVPLGVPKAGAAAGIPGIGALLTALGALTLKKKA